MRGHRLEVMGDRLKLFTVHGLRFTVFLLLSTVYFLLSTASAQENPCLMCHDQFKKPAKVVHAALGMGCETCHQAVAGMHPQQKGSMKLMQDLPGLCYGCHDESKFKGKVIHSPVAGGMCTGCHNPHQSEFNKILISDTTELCYNCHDKTEFTKKNVHPAVMMGCTSCHSPHVSDNPKLIPKAINALCTGCHAAKATGMHVLRGLEGFHPLKGVPDPSRPGKELNCASCHNPHSSDFAKLFPAAEKCQKCHKY